MMLTAGEIAAQLRTFGCRVKNYSEPDDCQDGEITFEDSSTHVQVGFGYACVVEDCDIYLKFSDQLFTVEDIMKELGKPYEP
jgi:hypothetical protein